MKKFTRKLLNILLTLAMAITIIPAIGTEPVFAAGFTKTGTIENDAVNGWQVLQDGYVYVVSSNTTTKNLRVADGATVVIYVKSGVTLTAKGDDATSYGAPGRAGIYLPSSSTLIITGKGTVIATGGNAAPGFDGADAGDGWVNYHINQFQGGKGGNGGAGGAGGGAGIGTDGGRAGEGGSGPEGNLYYTDPNSNARYNGNQGTNGEDGKQANSAGILYVYDASVTATGGTASDYQATGGAGGGGATDAGSGFKHDYAAGGGGGGGGGGNGAAGQNIGSGGSGGGGGGGGHSGGTWWNKDGNDFRVGTGGGGGGGTVRGQDGATPQYWNCYHAYYGTYGGIQPEYAGSGTLYSNKGVISGRTSNTSYNHSYIYYTLSYDGQGGSNVPSTQGVYLGITQIGATVNIPSRVGYTFNGYYTAPAGGTRVFDSSGTLVSGNGIFDSNRYYDVPRNTVLYAHWTPITYTVQFYSKDNVNNYNGAASYISGSERIWTYGSMTMPSASSFNLKRKNYDFIGWNLYEGQDWAMYYEGQTYSGGLTKDAGDKVVLYAAWAPKNAFTISYDKMGGTGSPISGICFTGEDFVIPTDIPVKTNCTFIGWDTSATADNPVYSAGDTIHNIQTGFTLYAVWKDNDSVSYDANGGQWPLGEAPAAVYPAEGTSVALEFGTETVPVKQGYTFAGWCRNKNGTGTIYKSGTYTMTDEPAVFYAIYEPVKYNINYSSDSRYSWGSSPATATHNDDLVFSLSIDTEKAISEKLKVAVNGIALAIPEPAVSGNTETYTFTVKGITAEQTVNVSGLESRKYGIVYYPNGGEISPSTDVYTGGAAYTLPQPSKTGYKFAGWYDNQELKGTAVTAIAAGTYENKQFYASWKAIEYTVYFKDDDNTTEIAAPINAVYDDDYTVLPAQNDLYSGSGIGNLIGWTTTTGGALEYKAGDYVKNLVAADNSLVLYPVCKTMQANEHLVVYNANGGFFAPDSRIVESGKEHQLSSGDTERDGYKLAGWSTDRYAATEDSSVLAAGSTITVNSDITLYAVWKPDTPVVITYHADDADAFSVTPDENGYYYCGTSYNYMPAETSCLYRTGYTAIGWIAAVNGGKPNPDIIYSSSNCYTIPSDATAVDFYAVWKSAEYKIMYMDEATQMAISDAIQYDSDYTIEDLSSIEYSKTGYELDGWAISPDSGKEYDAGQTVSRLYSDASATGEVNLYAVWKPVEISISLDDQGGSGGSESIIVTYDSYFPAALIPSKTGYDFAGYYSSAEDGIMYYDENMSSSIISDISEPCTFYARWIPKEYSVSYYINGSLAGAETAKYGTEVCMPSSLSSVPAGYKLIGWTYSSLADTVLYDVNTEYDLWNEIGCGSDVTLYGVIKKIEKYTVSYDKNGGTGIAPTDSNKYDYGDTLEITEFSPALSNLTYRFAGWSLDKNAVSADYSEENTSELNTIVMDDNKTLYAVWAKDSYEIIYDGNGGLCDDQSTISATIERGSSGTILSSGFNKDGYDHTGWGLVPYGTVKFNNGEAITRDITNADTVTLYALWAAHEYPVAYHPGDGATLSMPTGSVTYNKAYGAMPVPEKAGYNFKGWFDADGNEVKSTDIYTRTQGMDLYAGWEAVNYALSITESSMGIITVEDDYGITLYSGDAVEHDCGLSVKVTPRTGYTSDDYYLIINGIPYTSDIETGISYTVSGDTAVYLTPAQTAGSDSVSIEGETNAAGYSGIYDGLKHTLTAVFDTSELTDVKYRWYKDDVLSAVTSNNSIQVKSVSDSGIYTVEITGVDTDDVECKVTSEEATVEITRKDLQITANNNSIVYGSEPSAKGITGSGFATGDSLMTLKGNVSYAFDYSRYGNVGSYTITPSGLSSDDYDITYVPGKLTVSAKPVVLRWSASAFAYDSKVKTVTAVVNNTMHGDTVNVTDYIDNTATRAGNYTGVAIAVDNPNYTLEGGTGIEHSWQITTASLSSLEQTSSKSETAAGTAADTAKSSGETGSTTGSTTAAGTSAGTVNDTKSNDAAGSSTSEAATGTNDAAKTDSSTSAATTDTASVSADTIDTADTSDSTTGSSTTAAAMDDKSAGDAAKSGDAAGNANKIKFVDVKNGDYFYNAVYWAVENGITYGIDDTHFGPNQSTTRAQMVTFLWRLAGCPNPKSSRCIFTDVKPDAYYYKAVLWATETGITDGTSATAFSPDAYVTRCQAVTFLFRYKGKPAVQSENPFADVKTGAYYYNAVLWAQDNGITKGVDEYTFLPDANCTRGQIVTFIYRSTI